MGRYDEVIAKCEDTGKLNKYRLQGFSLMIILMFLFVNLIERQVNISEQKQHVMSKSFEVCVTSICLGDQTDDTAECLSLIRPTLSNVSILAERFSRQRGANRIVVRPLSECQ